VGHQLRECLPDHWGLDVLAEDGATTTDIERQLDGMPKGATHLLLSVGGNDALLRADILASPVDSSQEAFQLLCEAAQAFGSNYKRVLRQCLRFDLPMAICTIYEGSFDNQSVRQTTSAALTAFNDVIYRAAVEKKLPVLELRAVCNQAQDFVRSIEPSAVGGMKIAKTVARAAVTDFRSGASVLL
jgi:hypothetical protein